MEILVDGYSYDAKQKFIILQIRYTGITFLNKNYGTGMENALATLEHFLKNKIKISLLL